MVLVTVALGLGACGDPVDPGDAGSMEDAGSGEDAGSMDDAGSPEDAGPPVDATAGDAGRLRTGAPGPSMAICPPSSTLTYESFGEAFFTAYCVRCHSSTLEAGMRGGAPLGFDFDTRAGVEMHASRIDRVAAAGPTRVNTFMPLGEPKPTDDERDMLGEWIACGTP
jgi:hypothetical protein